MQESTTRRLAVDRWGRSGGLTRRAIVATIALWVVVIVGLYIALEVVRSPAFVA